MEKRITKKEYFKMLRKVVEVANVDNRDELITFIDDQIKLLDKKKSSVNTKKAAEIEATLEKIYEALKEINRPATATEVADKIGVSNQKASAYLKKLVEAERVVKTLDKKKSFFSVNGFPLSMISNS